MADSGARVASTIWTVSVNIQGWRGSIHDLLRDHYFFDALKTRQFEHRIEQNAFHDRAQATCPGLALDRLPGDIARSASSASVKSTFSISNNRRYCFISAFFGSTRMRLSVGSSRSSRVATTGRRPTNSRV